MAEEFCSFPNLLEQQQEEHPTGSTVGTGRGREEGGVPLSLVIYTQLNRESCSKGRFRVPAPECGSVGPGMNMNSSVVLQAAPIPHWKKYVAGSL